MTEDHRHVVVGGYADADQPGVAAFRMNARTGELAPVASSAGVANPSYVAVHPNGRDVYAVSETGPDTPDRGVAAWRFDPVSGALTPNGRARCGGVANCYLSVDPSGHALLTAHYASGSVASHRLQADGSPSDPVSVIQHEGCGPNAQRQEKAHAHSIVCDPHHPTLVYAADLGADRIFLHRLDPASAKLRSIGHAEAAAVGGGPRHLTVMPNGDRLFVLHELTGSIGVYQINRQTPSLNLVQCVNPLPEKLTQNNHSADIHVTPDGRFLYASHRGPDMITVHRIHADRIEYVGAYDAGAGYGRGRPRGFAIDPAGRFAVVGNKWEDRVVVCRINLDTGELTPTGHEAKAVRPACIKFVPQKL